MFSFSAADKISCCVFGGTLSVVSRWYCQHWQPDHDVDGVDDQIDHEVDDDAKQEGEVGYQSGSPPTDVKE